MTTLLAIIALLSFVGGLGNLLMGSTVIHSIAGLVCILLAVVSLIGIAVSNKLDDIKKSLKDRDTSKPSPQLQVQEK